MPREGEGPTSDNIAEGHEVIHGAGKEESSHVDRADKTAPMPEPEKGAAIEGMSASGGGDQGLIKGSDAGQGGKKM